MSELISYTIDGRVATITLNRPDKRNALNYDLVQALLDVLHELGRDVSVRVMLLPEDAAWRRCVIYKTPPSWKK